MASRSNEEADGGCRLFHQTVYSLQCSIQPHHNLPSPASVLAVACKLHAGWLALLGGGALQKTKIKLHTKFHCIQPCLHVDHQSLCCITYACMLMLSCRLDRQASMSCCPAPRRSSEGAADGSFTVDCLYRILSNFLHKLNDVFVNQLMLATHLQREANTGN